jgi:hypothetical protein
VTAAAIEAGGVMVNSLCTVSEPFAEEMVLAGVEALAVSVTAA